MFVPIQPSSGVPLAQQIVQGVKYLVASGRLEPGDRIPTVRELAKELQVNPATVVRAYDGLAQEGVIFKRQGKGTFVRALEDQDADPTQLREAARRFAIEGLRLGLDRERLRELLDHAVAGIEREGKAADERDSISRTR